MKPVPATFVLGLMLGGPLWAQLGAPLLQQGVPVRFDAGTLLFNATGQTWRTVLGCARDANGHWWITARRRVRQDPNSPHMLFELDAGGAFLAGYPQPQATATSRFGMRDLAFDGSRYLYGGCEADRIFAFDTIAHAFAPAHDVAVPAGLTFGTMRALAFDPSGNGGQGSLWVGNWSSEHAELDLAGNLLRRVPNVQRESFGAAYDPQRHTVWWFGQVGSTIGNLVHVVATEMSTASGNPTGGRFLGDLTLPAIDPGGFAGGVEFAIDGGEAALVLTVQGDTDWITEVKARFAFGSSSGGVIGSDGDAAYVGNGGYGVTLSNSPNDLATLLYGVGETAIALPTPAFAPATNLLVDLNLPTAYSPFVALAQGSARMPFPIPNLPQIAGIDLFFQWIEVPLQGGLPSWPIATSTGGKVHVAS